MNLLISTLFDGYYGSSSHFSEIFHKFSEFFQNKRRRGEEHNSITFKLFFYFDAALSMGHWLV